MPLLFSRLFAEYCLLRGSDNIFEQVEHRFSHVIEDQPLPGLAEVSSRVKCALRATSPNTDDSSLPAMSSGEARRSAERYLRT